MIKVSHTVPPAFFDWQEKASQCYLLLAHQLLRKDSVGQQYRKWVKERKPKLTVLDNGGYELGSAIADSYVAKLAMELRVDVVTLPDVFLDAKETHKRVDMFLKEWGDDLKKAGIKLMGVPQGRTKDEYLESFLRFYNNPSVHIIGLSFLVVDKCISQFTREAGVEVNRPYFIRLLQQLHLTKKPIHLLGLGDPIELISYRGDTFIESCDSSICFQLAMQKKVVSKEGYKRETFNILDFDVDRRSVDPLVEELFFENAYRVNLFAGQGNMFFLRRSE